MSLGFVPSAVKAHAWHAIGIANNQQLCQKTINRHLMEGLCTEHLTSFHQVNCSEAVLLCKGNAAWNAKFQSLVLCPSLKEAYILVYKC